MGIMYNPSENNIEDVALINHLITEDYQMYNTSENNSKEMVLINHLITEDDQKEIAKALKTIRSTTSHTDILMLFSFQKH
jgi:hypothetical protein